MMSHQFQAGYPGCVASTLRESLRPREIRRQLDEGLDRLFDHRAFTPESRFVFSGSGDSLFSGQGAVQAFRKWTGMDARALSSIEFARYEVPHLREQDILFAISNSGSASRTRETVALARAAGNLTVGLTGNRNTPLAQLSDIALVRPVSPLPDIDPSHRRVFLNMAEFIASLYSIYYVALRIAGQRASLSNQEVSDWLGRIEGAVESLGPAAENIDTEAHQLANLHRRLDNFWVIGAGPSYATARYCAAKFHEQIPLNGIPEDLEEWAHLQYFLTLDWGKQVVVFVLAPPGNALDRAEELVEGIANAGGLPIAVAHPNQGDFPKAIHRFAIPAPGEELISPLTYHLPVQLFVLHRARLAGVESTPLSRRDDYQLIRKSVVRESTAGLD